ncbi:hypothetical protein CICLE_v10006694mg [Citrus x clementina]|uniref:LOB domain-containing protein n=1 Tax=Citrus clementina TaxID=85681 RepID=V4S6A9_CITCL|nr:hypothetical protein CICLE_v10006694mg [Citrus x clementina]
MGESGDRRLSHQTTCDRRLSHQALDCKLIMDYEANSRIRDPVYGCAGTVCHLQKQVSELQADQQQNLIALICMEMAQSQEQVLHRHQQQQPQQLFIDTSCFLDEYSLGSTWEPLWT